MQPHSSFIDGVASVDMGKWQIITLGVAAALMQKSSANP